MTWFIFVIIPQISCCFSVIFTVLKQIVHWHYNVQVFCIVNECIINFLNTRNKRSNVFKCSIFIYFVSVSSSIKGNRPFHNNICIRIITHKSDLSIDALNLICLFGLYLYQHYLTDHELLPSF